MTRATGRSSVLGSLGRAACAAVVVLVASAARAQSAPPVGPASPTQPSPAQPSPAQPSPAQPSPPQRSSESEPPEGADPASAAEQEARDLFQRGLELYRKARCDEALPLLERSRALVESPNSGLLAARCQQAAGQRPRAAETFAAVERLAAARAAAGDTRYADAAVAAASEGAALRRQLGVLRVRVAGAPPGTALEVDGAPRALGADGAATVLREPGPVSLVLRAPGRAPVTRSATLAAGADASIDFLLDASGPAAAPAPLVPAPQGDAAAPAGGGSTWMLPAAVAAGTLGAIGLGAFIGFGMRSRDTYDELEQRCGPRCGDADTAEADAGRRDQVIANVSLGVGIAGAVTAVVFGVLEGSRARVPNARASRRAVVVGAGPSLGMTGRF